MGSTHRGSYGPFAEYGHMVQKASYWMAYNTLGQENQREIVTQFKKLVSFLFKVLLHCLSSSKVFLVAYERILQMMLRLLILKSMIRPWREKCELFFRFMKIN